MGNVNKGAGEPLGARQLLIKILREGGCEPTFDENDFIEFFFQDEHFIVDASDEYSFVSLIDSGWHAISVWDAEAVTEMKKVINQTNLLSRPKLVYAEGDDDMIYVSSIYRFPLHESIKNVDLYFHSNLISMMDLHRLFNRQEGDKPNDENSEDGSSDAEKGGEL